MSYESKNSGRDAHLVEKKLAVNSTTSFTKDLKIIGERFRIVNRNDKIR